MISSIIDGVLLCALAATSGCVLLMYRRLQRFDALQSEAAAAFARTARALDNAKAAMDALHADSGEMAVSLASRLNEARMVLNEFERVTEGAAPARRPEVIEEHRPAPVVRDPHADLLAEWEERFAGMRAAAEARGRATYAADPGPGASMNALVASHPTGTALAVSPSPSMPVTWRTLSEAAHRTF